jgi:hypothetical protein
MSLVHSRAQAAALSARMRAGPGAPAAAGTNRFLLRNSRGPVLDFAYGRYGDRIVVGDWDGNGTWTPGVLRGGRRWYSRTSSPAARPRSAWPSRPGDPGGRRLGQPALTV